MRIITQVALALVATKTSGVTIESSPLPSMTFSQVDALAEYQTRTGNNGKSDETFDFIPADSGNNTPAKCKRTTEYTYFEWNASSEMHEDTASTVSHVDFLPLNTCCAWAKLDTDTELASHPLVGACPDAGVQEEAYSWDDNLKQCLKSTTTMDYGDYTTSEPEVVMYTECCEAGIDPGTGTSFALKAAELVKACDSEPVYDCSEAETIEQDCKITITKSYPQQDGATHDVQTDANSEDDKLLICAAGIALPDGDANKLPFLKQCQASVTTDDGYKWDGEDLACYKEIKTVHYDGTPSPVFETQHADNKFCCYIDEDACEVTYDVPTEGDNMNKCTKSTQNQVEITDDTADLSVAVSVDESGDSCCTEGWRTESSILKGACNIATEERLYDATAKECTIVSTTITPYINRQVKYDVHKQECCAHQDDSVADEDLDQACVDYSAEQADSADGPQVYTYYNNPPLNWSDAKDACVGLGLELATIRSEDEQEMFNAFSDVFYIGRAWIGLERDVSNSVAWTSGYTANTLYTNWADFEPFGDESYACTQIKPDGEWATDQCHNSYGYFCSKY